MTIKGTLLSIVPIVSDCRSNIFEDRFSPKIDVCGTSDLNKGYNTSGVTGHRICSSMSVCDLYFKFEVDRTKTAVAIESDNYSFGQTDTSTDYILCPMP